MMDKQKQIEEMSDIIFNSRYKNDYISPLKGANELYNTGYRKIDKDSVVLSREEYEKEKLKLFAKAYNQGSNETAEKFAERVKMAFYYHFDELIPSIMADKIDEICKEITEGKVNE